MSAAAAPERQMLAMDGIAARFASAEDIPFRCARPTDGAPVLAAHRGGQRP